MNIVLEEWAFFKSGEVSCREETLSFEKRWLSLWLKAYGDLEGHLCERLYVSNCFVAEPMSDLM